MAVVSALSPVSLTSYFDDATGAVKHANLYFYKAGTLDAISVYTDALLSVAHPVPVLTTGNGRVPPVFIGEMVAPGYRVRAFDQYSQLIEDIDNLPGAIAPTTEDGGTPITPTDSMLKVGDIIASFTDGSLARSGFVRCNGGTVGAALSDATEMRSDDAYNLFHHLWQQDYALNLVVYAIGGTPSRGASATGDWDLGKSISTPDLRGRTIIGVDPMGAPAITNRTGGMITDSAGGNPALLGAYGGRAMWTLSLAEIPPHNHNLTQTAHSHTGRAPDHYHRWTGAVGADGWHQHGGTTYGQNRDHTHHFFESGVGTTSAGPGAISNFATPAVGERDTGGASVGHEHQFLTDGGGSHAHTVSGNVWEADRLLDFTTNGQNANITIDAQGGGVGHTNTQPFYALTYYMKW